MCVLVLACGIVCCCVILKRRLINGNQQALNWVRANNTKAFITVVTTRRSTSNKKQTHTHPHADSETIARIIRRRKKGVEAAEMEDSSAVVASVLPVAWKVVALVTLCATDWQSLELCTYKPLLHVGSSGARQCCLPSGSPAGKRQFRYRLQYAI